MLAAMMAATTATASFQNMVFPPWACDGAPPPSGGAVFGDLERVAIGGEHEQHGARLERFGTLDARVPGRAAVAHAREARTGVEPALEARRHAGVERRHALAARAGAVDVHPVAAGRGDHRRDNALHRKGLRHVGRRRGAERGHRQHHQIERPAQQLGDDEHQSDDGPGKRRLHGRVIWQNRRMLSRELISLHEAPREVPPFSERYPGLTPAAGYEAAHALHEHRMRMGWRPLGRKIGFTNRTLWQRYGVHEPMWGTVYD